MLAWRCVAEPAIGVTKVAYRTSTTLAEKSRRTCSEGETFFGKSVTGQDGSMWLSNESNGLFLPLLHPQTRTPMFEQVRWECIYNGTVLGRKTPNASDAG